jgi:putative transposase
MTSARKRPSDASVRRGHHCAYDIHYHFVFTVKYRRALLVPAVVEQIVYLSGEIEARYAFDIECLGADRDHIHLLCSAHPKMAPGEIVRIYKSNLARQLFRALPQLRQELWGGEFWSDGYFVATAAVHGDWNTLVRYIQEQGQQPEEVQLQLLLHQSQPQAAPETLPETDHDDRQDR